eukprot:g1766.t1
MANEWECVRCTFLNGHNALACNMCASPKHAAAPALQWACLQCTYLNGRNAAACDVCFSPKTAAALPSGVPLAAAAVGPVAKAEQWACIQCTYWNGSDVSACGMCASPRPAVSPVMRAETLTRQTAAAAAPKSPAQPAPHEAQQASSQIPKLGVSVSLLLATYQRWKAAGLAAGATTDDVVRDLIKPASADQKCSYVELLARSQDPQDRAGVATATVFLSHAWKYTFKQTSTVNPDFWFEAFRENVRTIGHTVLILSPWSNPVPLTRSWCRWEIFCTRVTKATFEICLPPAEAKDFQKALVEDFSSVVGSLSKIDVKKAEAFKKEDQEKILALVEGMPGGAHELNKAVLAEMRAWTAWGPRRPKGAEEFCRRCLKASEKTLGVDHPLTLATVNNLGTLLEKQGKLAVAEPLYRRALQGREKTLGAEHPLTLVQSSARVREVARGRAPTHLDFAQQPGHVAVAAGQAGGGRASVPQGSASIREDARGRAPAEPLYRRALQGREKTLGAGHPDTLISVNNLGVFLKQQGKLAEAELLHRRTLQEEKTLGAEHPSTLASVNNLGVLLYQQGKLAEAEVLYRRALQGRETTLGAGHPFTSSVNNLGMLLEQQGKLAEAKSLKRRAQEAKR